MKQLSSEAELREYRASLVGTLGFVPTMGALHEGHLSLVREAMSKTDNTIVSIYVNPTQFNNPNDLASYPDTLIEDLDALKEAGVDGVFLPTYELLYPDDFRYQVDEKTFSRALCGANRPGHFTGVLTVVMKLLNLVRPDKAFFGEKDYQQYLLIKGMVETFFIPTEIVACPIVREADGLAMSSRNLNLKEDDRIKSPQFYELLSGSGSDAEVHARLEGEGFEVDYVVSHASRRFGAVVMGDETSPVRLIDNVELS